VDLTRFHPRPCLQYYIKRCLGPCVKDLTTPDVYQEAVRDVKMFLEGRPTDLARSLRARMDQAAAAEEYERAARYRDLISTVEQLQERQRIAAAEGDDADVFGYHYENGMLAVNLFHMRGGKMVDRREFFWEELPEFAAATDLEANPEHVGTAAIGCPGERSSPFSPATEFPSWNLFFPTSRKCLNSQQRQTYNQNQRSSAPRTAEGGCPHINLYASGFLSQAVASSSGR
jgi:excinuclease ABC subunit C